MEEAAETDLRAVGARIAQARREAGLTQDQLSDVVGVGLRQIQYYESGTSNPYRTLRRIAEATGKSVGWLLHGDPATELAAEEVAGRLESLEASQERVEEGLAETRSLLRELLRRVGEGQGVEAPGH